MDRLDNLKESDKGSESTGSMALEDIKKERLKIIELSNESVLHGYDMAVQVLDAVGNITGSSTLMENRPIIELGLKNGTGQRTEIKIEGNINVGSDKANTEESGS